MKKKAVLDFVWCSSTILYVEQWWMRLDKERSMQLTDRVHSRHMVHKVTAAEVDGQLAVGGRLLKYLELDHHLACVLGLLWCYAKQWELCGCVAV